MNASAVNSWNRLWYLGLDKNAESTDPVTNAANKAKLLFAGLGKLENEVAVAEAQIKNFSDTPEERQHMSKAYDEMKRLFEKLDRIWKSSEWDINPIDFPQVWNVQQRLDSIIRKLGNINLYTTLPPVEGVPVAYGDEGGFLKASAFGKI